MTAKSSFFKYNFWLFISASPFITLNFISFSILDVYIPNATSVQSADIIYLYTKLSSIVIFRKAGKIFLTSFVEKNSHSEMP